MWFCSHVCKRDDIYADQESLCALQIMSHSDQQFEVVEVCAEDLRSSVYSQEFAEMSDLPVRFAVLRVPSEGVKMSDVATDGLNTAYWEGDALARQAAGRKKTDELVVPVGISLAPQVWGYDDTPVKKES
eukprot:GEMP01075215.1.p1 GENE.GEMP01075215.1~~GEMP01075215.1.p1  ORF type:complete len:130 (+),score=27.81 GEMP01075215.1:236-625(+)